MPLKFIAHDIHNARQAQLSQSAPSQAQQQAKPLAEEAEHSEPATAQNKQAREFGGPSGLEPTRYGDWEVGGIACDF